MKNFNLFLICILILGCNIKPIQKELKSNIEIREFYNEINNIEEDYSLMMKSLGKLNNHIDELIFQMKLKIEAKRLSDYIYSRVLYWKRVKYGN